MINELAIFFPLFCSSSLKYSWPHLQRPSSELFPRLPTQPLTARSQVATRNDCQKGLSTPNDLGRAEPSKQPRKQAEAELTLRLCSAEDLFFLSLVLESTTKTCFCSFQPDAFVYNPAYGFFPMWKPLQMRTSNQSFASESSVSETWYLSEIPMDRWAYWVFLGEGPQHHYFHLVPVLSPVSSEYSPRESQNSLQQKNSYIFAD